jgi:hypothetical protein
MPGSLLQLLAYQLHASIMIAETIAWSPIFRNLDRYGSDRDREGSYGQAVLLTRWSNREQPSQLPDEGKTARAGVSSRTAQLEPPRHGYSPVNSEIALVFMDP